MDSDNREIDRNRTENEIANSESNRSTSPGNEISGRSETRSSNIGGKLFRLGELDDYKVASNDPDVRGWDLVDRNSNKLGTVDELIVDTEKEQARYLDIIADQSLNREGTAKDRHFILPIGIARIDSERHNVKVDDLEVKVFVELPDYGGGEITREYESKLVEKLGRGRAPLANDADFYSDNFYDEDRFYKQSGRTP